MDIASGHFQADSFSWAIWAIYEESNEICWHHCLAIPGNLYPTLERQASESVAKFIPGRQPASDQRRLCMRLPENKILLLHDGSQDGRTLRLWNGRRSSPEGSTAR